VPHQAQRAPLHSPIASGRATAPTANNMGAGGAPQIWTALMSNIPEYTARSTAATRTIRGGLIGAASRDVVLMPSRSRYPVKSFCAESYFLKSFSALADG
jgi:hypothetical protein